MKLIIFIALTVAVTSVFCYHDPDLNYHLSQVQKITPNCNNGNGYNYPAPAVQLSTSGVKYAAPSYIPPITAPVGYSSAGYQTGITYQAPKITYAAQPAAYQTSSLISNYATATNEAHGYATSAGLSSATSPRPITPSLTYAQAPIIAKVTGSPLIAKFAIAPAKTTYTASNLIAQQPIYYGSLAKASLNSYSNVQTGGPVVSQVYAAPRLGYTTAPALQAQQVAGYSVAAPGVQYAQSGNVGQYASTVSQVSAPTATYFSAAQQVAQQYAAPVAQYSQAVQYAPTAVATAPAVNHYSAPAIQYRQYSVPTVAEYPSGHGSSKYATQGVVAQYAVPAVKQYAAPAVTQYAAPAAVQYAAPNVVHHAAPTIVKQYAAPAAVQYAAPAATHYSPPVVQYSSPAVATHYSTPAVQHSSPAVATISQYSAPATVTRHGYAPALTAVAAPLTKTGTVHAVKNVHTDFLENYDAHPRYAFEYGVNDPHTGDIKQQKEERDGEVVKGQYSLVEPDGSVRTVNYVADWETGFHANVHNSKDNKH